MLHFFLEVLQNFMSLNSYGFFIIYTFLPYMALFDRFYKKTNYGSFFLWKSNGPIFSKMYFKLWSSSELPFMGYKRFSPKSPHGANGEGKERVKRLFTIFLDFPFIIVSETVICLSSNQSSVNILHINPTSIPADF